MRYVWSWIDRIVPWSVASLLLFSGVAKVSLWSAVGGVPYLGIGIGMVEIASSIFGFGGRLLWLSVCGMSIGLGGVWWELFAGGTTSCACFGKWLELDAREHLVLSLSLP